MLLCVYVREETSAHGAERTDREREREREIQDAGVQFTNDEDASAGSDASDHVGGDTLPFSVILLAEGQELQAAAGEDVVLTLARLAHLPETNPS